jgi:hypothetical protein
MGGKELAVGMFVEPPHRLPWFPDHVHIFRVAVGAAFLPEFHLEDIQQCGLSSVRIAGFLQGKATGYLSPDKPNPLLCDKTDSGDTTMVVLVGVGKAENPVGSHGAASSNES